MNKGRNNKKKYDSVNNQRKITIKQKEQANKENLRDIFVNRINEIGLELIQVHQCQIQSPRFLNKRKTFSFKKIQQNLQNITKNNQKQIQLKNKLSNVKDNLKYIKQSHENLISFINLQQNQLYTIINNLKLFVLSLLKKNKELENIISTIIVKKVQKDIPISKNIQTNNQSILQISPIISELQILKNQPKLNERSLKRQFIKYKQNQQHYKQYQQKQLSNKSIIQRKFSETSSQFMNKQNQSSFKLNKCNSILIPKYQTNENTLKQRQIDRIGDKITVLMSRIERQIKEIKNNQKV